MIPPADSLLKYDNPALISKNTDRKSPKVSDSSTPSNNISLVYH